MSKEEPNPTPPDEDTTANSDDDLTLPDNEDIDEPTPEPEQCRKYYTYEGEKKYADDFKVEEVWLYYENGKVVGWNPKTISDDKTKEAIPTNPYPGKSKPLWEEPKENEFDCSDITAMYERYFENEGYNTKFVTGSKFQLGWPPFVCHTWAEIECKDGSWKAFEGANGRYFKESRDSLREEYWMIRQEDETVFDYLSGFLLSRPVTEVDWWKDINATKNIKWCDNRLNK